MFYRNVEGHESIFLIKTDLAFLVCVSLRQVIAKKEKMRRSQVTGQQKYITTVQEKKARYENFIESGHLNSTQTCSFNPLAHTYTDFVNMVGA